MILLLHSPAKEMDHHQDLVPTLQKIRKGWPSLEGDEKERENEKIHRLINNQLSNAIKVIEICPFLKSVVTSNESMFIYCWHVVFNWNLEKISDEYTELNNALKFLGHKQDLKCQHEELESRLIELIGSDFITNETALICGTTLAKVIVKKYDGPASVAVKFQNIKEEIKDKSYTSICVIEGFLNCGRPEVFLALVSHDDRFVLLEEICQFCIKNCSTNTGHIFQNFHCLKVLSQRIKLLSAKPFSGEKQLMLAQAFGCSSPIVNEMWNLADANWENPVKGVAEIVIEVVSNVLDVCQILDPENYEGRLENTFRQNMDSMAWKIKGKYPLLQILLPRIGVSRVLKDYPNFADGLAESLTSNYLASAGSTVYRTVLKNISLEEWKKCFLPVLVDAMTSHVPIIQTNAKNHWLHSTVMNFSKSAKLLKQVFSEKNESSSLAAFLLTLKTERSISVTPLELTESDLVKISEGLMHASSETRCAAFSVICNTKQLGRSPTEKETEMVLNFIPKILLVDSSAFRQVLTSDMTLLLLRCRDFLTLKQRKNNLKVEHNYLIRFLDSLMEILFSNCYPGANYQRLVTSLELLTLISDCFFAFKRSGMNKASGNGDPKGFVEHCANMGLFRFQTPRHFDILLKCASYYMSDVREKAVNLLTEFQPDSEQIREIAEKGFELICSPKFAECESGGHLMRLVQHWTRNSESPATTQKYFEFLHFHEFISARNNNIEKVISPELTQTLGNLYSSCVSNCEGAFVQYSRFCPLHGMLTALRICLQEIDIENDVSYWSSFVKVLENSVGIMLRILSPEGNASFEDTSNAINEMIDCDSREEDLVEIPENHQLLLACAWLNLKECALLSSLLAQKLHKEMSVSLIERFGGIMLSILTKSRHKGAIESAQVAMKEFSSCILMSTDLEKRAIPGKMLSNALDDIEKSHASITRRSAGLPMLVQRIVSSEPKGLKRHLLKNTVSRLLEISEIKVTDFNELNDLPQSHALHILRSLIHDSTLANDIGQFVPSIIVTSVKQFASPFWSVRNASLQLFGSIMPRVLGQKKVKNMDSIHNSLTVNEFFARYHDQFYTFLLDQLNAKGDGKAQMVNPALVPLLSMMSRLTPGNSTDEKILRSVSDFKKSFFFHLQSSVINVRILAAKAFSAFTSVNDIETELEQIMNIFLNRPATTNFRNGMLYCAKSLVFRTTSKKAYSPQFLSQLETLKSTSGGHCCANLVLINCILSLVGVEFRPEMRKDTKCYEPYCYQFQDLIEQKDNKSSGNTMLQNGDLQKLVDDLTEILEETSNGIKISEGNEIIAQNSSFFQENPEAALDLLDYSTDERIVSGSLGLTAKTSSMVSTSISFNAMMMQEDFGMFFRDESPYLSRFVEFTEEVKSCSTSDEIETARLHSAQSLTGMNPIFKMRPIGSLPLLLQYGFVNLCNSALILLVDENTEVREIATRFVNDLEIRNAQFKTIWSLPSICTTQALHKLIMFGLCEFGDCLDWFEPIVEIFFKPWTEDSVAVLEKSLVRQCLFETGEGVNVYAEPVSLNIASFEMIQLWSSKQNVEFVSRFNLNLSAIVKSAKKCLDYCTNKSSDSNLLSCQVAWTNLGYLTVARFYHLFFLLETNEELVIKFKKYIVH